MKASKQSPALPGRLRPCKDTTVCSIIVIELNSVGKYCVSCSIKLNAIFVNKLFYFCKKKTALLTASVIQQHKPPVLLMLTLLNTVSVSVHLYICLSNRVHLSYLCSRFKVNIQLEWKLT